MISIIPKDETIVIDGEGVTDNEKMRVSKMFDSDIHAIQFDPKNNIGEIEFVKTPFPGSEPDRLNKRITSEDLELEEAISLHRIIIKEVEAKELDNE